MSTMLHTQTARFIAAIATSLPEIPADVMQGWIENPKALQRALREALCPVVSTIYKIVVDYRQTLEQMVAAGCYDRVNSDITAGRFPVMGEGQVELEPELVHIGHDISSEAVLVELEKRGLRAGTIAELLAFGATYPEVQREFSIVALGSVAEVDGSRSVAFLIRCDSRRFLRLGWFGDGWGGGCRFLAFCKVSGS